MLPCPSPSGTYSSLANSNSTAAMLTPQSSMSAQALPMSYTIATGLSLGGGNVANYLEQQNQHQAMINPNYVQHPLSQYSLAGTSSAVYQPNAYVPYNAIGSSATPPLFTQQVPNLIGSSQSGQQQFSTLQHPRRVRVLPNQAQGHFLANPVLSPLGSNGTSMVVQQRQQTTASPSSLHRTSLDEVMASRCSPRADVWHWQTPCK